MAQQKRRWIDVWIVESNTVYREVPYTVVTDWVQQGRLLTNDRVRPSGTAEWFTIGSSPAFAAFMPRMQEHRAEDQAEALEPVQVEFTWKRPEEEDEDVDMIPLIDISLVLLIFFMMTASVGGGLFRIDTPEAKNKHIVLTEDMKLWVGIDLREKKGGPTSKTRPWYSLGLKDELLVKPTQDRDQFIKQIGPPLEKELAKLIEDLKRKLARKEIGKVDAKVMIRIRADQTLAVEIIKNMTVALKRVEAQIRGKLVERVQIVTFGEVSERKAI